MELYGKKLKIGYNGVELFISKQVFYSFLQFEKTL